MVQTPTAAKQRITLAGAAIDAILAVIKLFGGLIGQSQALIADAAHSASDLASDVLVLWAAHIGGQPPDENHPYGHERFETAATLGLGATLLVVAGAFAYDAFIRLLHPDELAQPGWLALSIACVSVIAKEGAYQFTMRVARRYDSDMLRANAWHSRNDALSSLIVIVGVLGSLAGLVYLDAVAALAVSLLIGVTGWQLGWRAGEELVDTGLDTDETMRIRELIQAVDGVESHSDLRTRRMGNRLLIDMTVRIDPMVTASEAERILRAVRMQLHEGLSRHCDVTVSMEMPTPDESAHDAPPLPLRAEIEAHLLAAWRDLLPPASAYRLLLHYRAQSIDVDVLLLSGDGSSALQAAELERQLAEAVDDIEPIGTVQLFLRADHARA